MNYCDYALYLCYYLVYLYETLNMNSVQHDGTRVTVTYFSRSCDFALNFYFYLMHLHETLDISSVQHEKSLDKAGGSL